MTHKCALAWVVVLLAGCSTAAVDVPEHGISPGHLCDNSNVEAFIGKAGTRETGAAIMRSTQAAVLRWAPPGVMLTMEYRADRVTVRLGSDGKITSINCG